MSRKSLWVGAVLPLFILFACAYRPPPGTEATAPPTASAAPQSPEPREYDPDRLVRGDYERYIFLEDGSFHDTPPVNVAPGERFLGWTLESAEITAAQSGAATPLSEMLGVLRLSGRQTLEGSLEIYSVEDGEPTCYLHLFTEYYEKLACWSSGESQQHDLNIILDNALEFLPEEGLARLREQGRLDVAVNLTEYTIDTNLDQYGEVPYWIYRGSVDDLTVLAYHQLFTSVSGAAPATELAVGDAFLGWTVQQLEVTRHNYSLLVTGSQSVEGVLTRHPDDPLFGTTYSFQVSGDSADRVISAVDKQWRIGYFVASTPMRHDQIPSTEHNPITIPLEPEQSAPCRLHVTGYNLTNREFDLAVDVILFDAMEPLG